MSVNALDRARHLFADRIIEYATANATVELPDVLVAREVEMMIDELKVRTAQQGIRYEDYLRVTEKSEAGLREEYQEPAEHRVKVLLVLGSIADKEAVDISDAEVEAEIAHLRAGEEANRSVADYLDSDRGRSYVRSQLRRSAVVELIVDRWIDAHPEFAEVQHQHQPHTGHDHEAPSLIDEVIGDEDEDESAELAAIEAAAAEEARA
jgi:FKBP-type peptidyl-prolyl cis-trans isomerase (trigger factor)